MKEILKKTLIKKEFVKAYSKKYGVSYNKSKEIVENVLTLMKENFKNDNSLIFRGLGSFEIKVSKRRIAINPKTGETIKVFPKKYIKFKTSHNLFK